MARISLILSLTFSLPIIAFAQGGTPGTAAVLDLNGNASSTMSTSSTSHYWKVTTTANGYLKVEVNSASSMEADIWMHDTDGTTTIRSDQRAGTYSMVDKFVKPGTYFIQVWRYSGSGSYSISNTFTQAPRSADPEPNDTYSSAGSANPDGSVTGHIGYYGSGSSDVSDYWKIAVVTDGWLRIQVRSDSLNAIDQPIDLDVWLFDVDGTTIMSSDLRTGTFSQVSRFVKPDTYYVQVWNSGGRAGSYELSSSLLPPPLGGDGEGNDSPANATGATVNGTVTGHIGYYSNGKTNYSDYWKFENTSDGKMVVSVVSDSLDRSGAALDLDIWAYDVNGTTIIASDQKIGPRSEITLHLQPETFFVQVWKAGGNAGSYSLTINHTPPQRANDVEGNDTPSTAAPLTFGVTNSGHLGYFANGTTDYSDYWRLTAPSNDSLYVHVTSDATLDVDVYLYGPDGVTLIASDQRTGTYSRIGIRPTAGASYHIQTWKAGGTAGSYSIVAVRSSAAVSINDESPDRLIPTEFTLEQNYPNPFNPSTTIRYGLPKEARVKIAVYSILGQEIATLQDGVQSAGYRSLVWDGKNSHGPDVPSGVYLIRLQADERHIVKKAVLIR